MISVTASLAVALRTLYSDDNKGGRKLNPSATYTAFDRSGNAYTYIPLATCYITKPNTYMESAFSTEQEHNSINISTQLPVHCLGGEDTSLVSIE